MNGLLANCLSMSLSKKATTYSVNADLTSFVADKLFLGQKVEAASLKVNASTDGYQIKGDVKINGLPAGIEVRRKRGDVSAELRLQASAAEPAGVNAALAPWLQA